MPAPTMPYKIVRSREAVSSFAALQTIPIIMFQCSPKCKAIRINPQQEDAMCIKRPRAVPPSIGRNKNTNPDKMMPLIIRVSMAARTMKSTITWKILWGVYFPRYSVLYQFCFWFHGSPPFFCIVTCLSQALRSRKRHHSERRIRCCRLHGSRQGW